MNKIKQTGKLLKLGFRLIMGNPHLIAFMLASGLSVGILFFAAASPIIIKAVLAQKISPEIFSPYAKIMPVTVQKSLNPSLAKVSNRFMDIFFAKQMEPTPYMKARRPTRSTETNQADRFSARYAAHQRTEYQIRPKWAVFLPIAFATYFLCTFSMVFFNVALLISVRKLLNGQTSGFRESLSSAWEKRKDIALWALFSATVVLALDRIKNKTDNILTRGILGGLSVAWKLATFMIVPVLAVEGGNPKQVIERSAGLFKKTWGESITGIVGLGIIELTVMSLGLFTFGYLLITSIFSVSMSWLPVIGAFAALAASILVVLLCKMIASVFPMALYVYATEGVVPEEYQGEETGWFVAPQAK